MPLLPSSSPLLLKGASFPSSSFWVVLLPPLSFGLVLLSPSLLGGAFPVPKENLVKPLQHNLMQFNDPHHPGAGEKAATPRMGGGKEPPPTRGSARSTTTQKEEEKAAPPAGELRVFLLLAGAAAPPGFTVNRTEKNLRHQLAVSTASSAASNASSVAAHFSETKLIAVATCNPA